MPSRLTVSLLELPLASTSRDLPGRLGQKLCPSCNVYWPFSQLSAEASFVLGVEAAQCFLIAGQVTGNGMTKFVGQILRLLAVILLVDLRVSARCVYEFP